MKKISIIAFAAALLCTTAYLGYGKFQEHSFKSAAQPIIKNAALRTAAMLKYEYEPSGVTYKEMFDIGERNIQEIESKKIDVASISTPATEKASKITIEYLDACQKLIRKQVAFNRASLHFSSVIDNSPSNSYSSSIGSMYYLNLLTDHIKKLEKASEDSTSAMKSFVAEANSMLASNKATSELFDESLLVPNESISKTLLKLDPKPESKSKSKSNDKGSAAAASS